MSQSDAGKGDGHRPTLVSRKELDLRKRLAFDPDFNPSEQSMKRRIARIRKKTGKP